MAGSFNKVILMGNLTRDPELRYTPQGTAVTDISIAINDNRSKQNNPKATYVDITFWDKSAEVVCEYLGKGSSILVEGRLTNESWQDRDTGKTVYKTKVIAQNFQFTERKQDNGGNQNYNNNYQQGSQYQNQGNRQQGGNNYNNQGGYQGGGRNNTGYAQQGQNDYQQNSFNYNDNPPDDDIPF